MKLFYTIFLSSVTTSNVFAATPEHGNWYYPFYRQNCIGSPTNGNVLPWCIRLPVQNLICSSNKPVNLPSCVRVSGSTQVTGQVAFAKVSGSANSLNETAKVDGSQITCPDGPLDASCIQLGANSFPNNVLPAGVTVDGLSQVIGSVPLAEIAMSTANLQCTPGQETTSIGSCFRIAANQVSGSVISAISADTANNLKCATGQGTTTIDSCFQIPANQISGSVVSALSALSALSAATANNLKCATGQGTTTIDSCFQIPANQISGSVTANNLKCATGQGTTTIDSCFQIPANQVSGSVISALSADTAHNLKCATGQGTTTIDSCFEIPATQVTGSVSNAYTANDLKCDPRQKYSPLGSCYKIPGGQVIGNVSLATAAYGLTCPAASGLSTIPSCYTLNATQIKVGNLNGNLIVGTIDSPNVTFDSNVGPVACQSIRSCLFKDAFGLCDPPVIGDSTAQYNVTCVTQNATFYTGYCPENNSAPPTVACTYDPLAIGIPVVTWSSVRTHQGCMYTCTVSGLSVNTAILVGPGCTSHVSQVCI